MGSRKKKAPSNPDKEKNITIVPVEIDYDKLAEAIVKANRKADELIANNAITKSFSFTSSIILYIIAGIGYVISSVFLCASIIYISEMVWLEFFKILSNILTIFEFLSLIVLIGLYSHLLWGAAKEIEKEKDKNFVVSIFSGVVGFVALIVALIALFRGVV